ncbi:hypothetical protein [Bosea sp. 2RAB26]|uniref:hypothetical protein n=1 Tax=Bosea sp. 2RAB26 TaxID=3237476 RepID=UPI003F8DD710
MATRLPAAFSAEAHGGVQSWLAHPQLWQVSSDLNGTASTPLVSSETNHFKVTIWGPELAHMYGPAAFHNGFGAVVAAEPALRKLDSLRSMRLFSSPVTRHRDEDARQRALARMDALERAAAVEIFDSLFAKAQGGSRRPHASRVDCCSIVLNCLGIVRKRVISVTYRFYIGLKPPILVVKLHLSGVELPTRDASRARN